jgi:hypothetical protein
MRTRRLIALLVLVGAALGSGIPSDAHVQDRYDARDSHGRFDIQTFALRHGSDASCYRSNCIVIGIKTYENWLNKSLQGDHKKFFILFGAKRCGIGERVKNCYDRYLMVYWNQYRDHLAADMKTHQPRHDKGIRSRSGVVIGHGGVSKIGRSLAVRFPRRLLRKRKGTKWNLTHRIYWQAVSEYKGQYCRKVCWDPTSTVIHKL